MLGKDLLKQTNFWQGDVNAKSECSIFKIFDNGIGGIYRGRVDSRGNDILMLHQLV
jgi:hypothetical protein